MRSRKFLRFSSSVILDLDPVGSSLSSRPSSSEWSISMSMLLIEMDPPFVLDFLLAGALASGSSALRRPVTAPALELRFPRARVLGRASSLSSDPALASLAPRTELPVSDGAPFIWGDVLMGCTAGAVEVAGRAATCTGIGATTGYDCTAGGCVVLRPCANMNNPFAASLSCGSKGPGGFESALTAGWAAPAPLDSAGCDVGAAAGSACWACFAAAALTAVRWKSMVPGVAAVPKRAGFGLGTGNMDPLPPGVRPVRPEASFGDGKPPGVKPDRSEDSFGVGKPPRMPK